MVVGAGGLKYFVPGVVAAAALAFIVWTLGAWLVTGEANISRAVFAALATLIMGYPCALGMAAPLAMIRGGGIAAGRGIMMRSGEAFQAFKDVRQVLLDKTGTITVGKPPVSDVGLIEGVEEKEFLKLAASAEVYSEHPLGRAIVEYADDMDIELGKAEDFQTHTGKGVVAEIDGQRLIVGPTRVLQEQNMGPAA